MFKYLFIGLLFSMSFLIGVNAWAEVDTQRMQLNGAIKMLTSFRVQSTPIKYTHKDDGIVINSSALTIEGRAKQFEFNENGSFKVGRSYHKGDVLYSTITFEYIDGMTISKRVGTNGRLMEERTAKLTDNGTKREIHVINYDRPVELTKYEVLDKNGRPIERQLANVTYSNSGGSVSSTVKFSKLTIDYTEHGKKLKQIRYRTDDPAKIRTQEDYFYAENGFLKRTEKNNNIRGSSDVYHYIADKHGNWIYKYQINGELGKDAKIIVKTYREIEYYQ